LTSRITVNHSTATIALSSQALRGKLDEASPLLESEMTAISSSHGHDDPQFLRSLRHNPCLMSPVSGFMLFVFCLFSLVTLIFKLPEFLIGFLLSPLLARTQWFVGKLWLGKRDALN
jgi:hypothetical protein